MQAQATTRIVLADDHKIVRRAVRLLVEAEPGYDVVAEAGDTSSAVRALERERPDVLVLDVHLPGESGIAALPRLRRASPGTAVVVLTMDVDPGVARAALCAGALAYVPKDADGPELMAAIRAAVSGQRYVDPAMGGRLATELTGAETADGLTEREREVLRLIALGHTNEDIGHELFLSVRTIENIRTRIHRKTGCATRAEHVRYALENGVLDISRQAPQHL